MNEAQKQIIASYQKKFDKYNIKINSNGDPIVPSNLTNNSEVASLSAALYNELSAASSSTTTTSTTDTSTTTTETPTTTAAAISTPMSTPAYTGTKNTNTNFQVKQPLDDNADGAWGGFLAGAATGFGVGATASIWTGPGALVVGGIGAVIGGIAGAITGGTIDANNKDDLGKYTIDSFNKALNSAVADGDTKAIDELATILYTSDEVKSLKADNDIQKVNLENFAVINNAKVQAVINAGGSYRPKSANDVLIPTDIMDNILAEATSPKSKTVQVVGYTPQYSSGSLFVSGTEVPTNNNPSAGDFGTSTIKSYPDAGAEINAFKSWAFNNGKPIKIIDKDGKKYGVTALDWAASYYRWGQEQYKANPKFDIDPTNADNIKAFETSEGFQPKLTIEVSEDFISKQNEIGWLTVNAGITDFSLLTSDSNNPGQFKYDGKPIDLTKYADVKYDGTGETVAEMLMRVTSSENKNAYLDIFNTMGSPEAFASANATLTAEAEKVAKQYEQSIRTWAYQNNLEWDDDMIKNEAIKVMGTNYIFDQNNLNSWVANQYSTLDASGITGKYQHWADKLKEGYTVRGLSGGYIDVLANLYGVDKDSIGLNDRLLSPAIMVGKDGKINMSLPEYITWLKSQPEYERTEAGRAETAGFAALLRSNIGA